MEINLAKHEQISTDLNEGVKGTQEPSATNLDFQLCQDQATEHSMAEPTHSSTTISDKSKRGRPTASRRTKSKRSLVGSNKKTKYTTNDNSNSKPSQNGLECEGESEHEISTKETSELLSIDPGPYCICRGPDDHRWMIGCEICDDWFHGECVGLSKGVGESLVDTFVCPTCQNVEQGIQTLYRRPCALEGCLVPARVYNNKNADAIALEKAPGGPETENTVENQSASEGSRFCCDAHKDTWWNNHIATMSKECSSLGADELTQAEFISMLSGKHSGPNFPFNGPPFDPKLAPNPPLTEEERDIIGDSEMKRRLMGEEIIVLNQMYRLLELFSKRRSAAINAGKFDKDTCGYDIRCDFVGEPTNFRLFAKLPEISPLFKHAQVISTNAVEIDASAAAATLATLGPPKPLPEELAATLIGYERFDFETPGGGGMYGTDELIGGMCDRKRCRPHAGWFQIHIKYIKSTILYLKEAAAIKLEEERKIKEHASIRFLMRKQNYVSVRVLDGRTA